MSNASKSKAISLLWLLLGLAILIEVGYLLAPVILLFGAFFVIGWYGALGLIRLAGRTYQAGGDLMEPK